MSKPRYDDYDDYFDYEADMYAWAGAIFLQIALVVTVVAAVLLFLAVGPR